MELKPFASLGATLLARKGGAKPAMRPQLASIDGMGGAQAARAIADDLEDLGWNDMGQDDDPPHQAQVLPLTPAPAGPQPEAEAFDDDDARAERSAIHTPAGFASSYEPHDFSEDEDEIYDLGSAPREDDEDDDAYEEADAYEAPEDEAPEPAPVFAPIEPEVHRQQRALSASLRSADERTERRPERRNVEAIDSRRAAFTLRLDARRHLKLRLASTIKNRSAQQLVTQALDKFLAEIPEIEALAAQVQRD